MNSFPRLRAFLRGEAGSGTLIGLAAVIAVIAANSPLREFYALLLETPMTVRVASLTLAKPLLFWIDDGLMAIFFLTVGLEIKREVLQGELASLAKAAMPVVAAIGGMLVPAAIYAAVAWHDPIQLRGWAIPAATDIAFALAALALVGSGLPRSLRVFLLALAIIDDLGAILIIACFYTSEISTASLALAAVGLVALSALNRLAVMRIAPYVVVGIFLWVFVLKSGVHATLAGVAVAFAIPLGRGADQETSPFFRLEHALHPWVVYCILPLFAFANSGVSLTNFSWSTLLEPVPLGIAAGLFAGKQIGVLLFAWAATRLGIGARPEGATWAQLYGVALLCGIGFTMSLFIGGLAFEAEFYVDEVRIGVIAGSLLSALAGFLVLRSSRHMTTRR